MYTNNILLYVLCYTFIIALFIYKNLPIEQLYDTYTLHYNKYILKH